MLENLDNRGEILVKSGSLKIFSNLTSSGLLNISMGEELALYGERSFINGKMHLEVDGLLPNPVRANGSLTFGKDARLEVQVRGTMHGQFSEIDVIGDVSLDGTLDL